MSEYLLESGKGGSIANVAYCPCGVNSTSQKLYKELLDDLFKRDEQCLGRAVFAAKCSVIARYRDDDSIYGPAVLWTLFGDPALRVRHRVQYAVADRPSPRTLDFGLSVAPNPCDASVTINLSSPPPTPYSLSVYDASGRLVHSSFGIRDSSFRLDVRSMPDGVYVSRCVSGAGCASARLLIQH